MSIFRRARSSSRSNQKNKTSPENDYNADVTNRLMLINTTANGSRLGRSGVHADKKMFSLARFTLSRHPNSDSSTTVTTATGGNLEGKDEDDNRVECVNSEIEILSHRLNKKTNKPNGIDVESLIPFLHLDLSSRLRNERFMTKMRSILSNTSTSTMLLKFLSSSESTFRVMWNQMNSSLRPSDYLDERIEVSIGKFTSMAEEEHLKNTTIIRGKIQVKTSVHEVMHILINQQKDTPSFNSFWTKSNFLNSAFIGGEVLLNLDVDEDNVQQLPNRSIKRFIAHLGPIQPRDFVYIDLVDIEQDPINHNTDVGIYAFESICLPETDRNIRGSKAIRGNFLPGCGIIARKSYSDESLVELTMILRVDLGKMKPMEKIHRKKRMIAKLLSILKTLSELGENGVYSLGKHLANSPIKLFHRDVNNTGRPLSTVTLRITGSERTQEKEHEMLGLHRNDFEPTPSLPLLDIDVLKSSITEESQAPSICHEENNSDPLCSQINEQAYAYKPEELNRNEMTTDQDEIEKEDDFENRDYIHAKAPNEFSLSPFTMEKKGENNESRSSIQSWEPEKSKNSIDLEMLYKRKYEEVVLQKIKLEAEVNKLKAETAVRDTFSEHPSLEGAILEPKQPENEEFDKDQHENDTASSIRTPCNQDQSSQPQRYKAPEFDPDEVIKIKAELERQLIENAQLRKKYEVMKAQTQNESLDKYNWDGSLESAEKTFLKLATQVQQDASDMVILNDFEKFEEIIRKHPDYKKREEIKIQTWLKENEPINQRALVEMKTIIPPEIHSMSKKEIMDRFSDSPNVGRRICNNRNAFSFYFMTPTDIQRLHVVDLKNKFDPKNLDLTELRAYFTSLPATFLADAGNEKAIWKDNIRKKLEDMVKQAAAGTLPKARLRDPAYSKCLPSDPDIHSPAIQPPVVRRPPPIANQDLLNALQKKSLQQNVSEIIPEDNGAMKSIGRPPPNAMKSTLMAAIQKHDVPKCNTQLDQKNDEIVMSSLRPAAPPGLLQGIQSLKLKRVDRAHQNPYQSATNTIDPNDKCIMLKTGANDTDVKVLGTSEAADILTPKGLSAPKNKKLSALLSNSRRLPMVTPDAHVNLKDSQIDYNLINSFRERAQHKITLDSTLEPSPAPNSFVSGMRVRANSLHRKPKIDIDDLAAKLKASPEKSAELKREVAKLLQVNLS